MAILDTALDAKLLQNIRESECCALSLLYVIQVLPKAAG